MARDEAFSDETTIARAGMAIAAVGIPFVLTVVAGPDAGASFRVDASIPSRVLIGKGPVCDLRLKDSSVSRRHAAVEVSGGMLRLVDLDSTNGTTVNGLRVREAFLRGGELVHLGNTQITVSPGPPAAHAPRGRASQFGEMLGASDTMRRLYPLCERLAAADVPVIIEGETGVGKEQLARALHDSSPRAAKPFVVFDCTAVAPNLIESELFGHERGAFTGSVAAHQGVFERANGGTLLIDEIGDFPLELQPKLLRAVERLELTRIGGARSIQVDVRILAATRRDLDREVFLGRFRDDLFHRIAIARIELPPLRERKGDVELLAAHFWAALGGNPALIPTPLLQSWSDYGWPGNIRELKNAVTRRFALGDLADLSGTRAGSSIGEPSRAVHAVSAAGDTVQAILALGLPYSDAKRRMLSEFDQRYVDAMLDAHDGNVTRAAAAAGVGRRYFQRVKARSREDGER